MSSSLFPTSKLTDPQHNSLCSLLAVIIVGCPRRLFNMNMTLIIFPDSMGFTLTTLYSSLWICYWPNVSILYICNPLPINALATVYVNSFLAMFNARHRLQASMNKTALISGWGVPTRAYLPCHPQTPWSKAVAEKTSEPTEFTTLGSTQSVSDYSNRRPNVMDIGPSRYQAWK